MAKFKLKIWDGKIRLLNIKNGKIYQGLLSGIIDYCKENNFEYELIEKESGYFNASSLSEFEAKEYIEKELKLPSSFEVRDYQLKAFVSAIRNKRRLFLSPTSSGKSLIIYMVSRYLLDTFKVNKWLIIVPRTALAIQLSKDFEDYGYDKPVGTIFSGKKKEVEPDIVISTWQSIYSIIQKDSEWLDKFDGIIGDEAHLFKSNVLTKIMEGAREADIRFGFTGTLDESLTNEMVLRGLFGEKEIVTTIKKLTDDGYVSKLLIKSILLSYPEEDRKKVSSNRKKK